MGGGRPAGLERGYYLEPTVLDVPDNTNPPRGRRSSAR